MRFTIKVSFLTIAAMILALALGSVVYGANASRPVTVGATVDNFIAMDPVANVNLAPNITGIGGSASGSTIVHVSTNNDLGYSLEATASGAPGSAAMTKGLDSFADYSGPVIWSIGANESAFGFSVNNTTNYHGFAVGSAVPLYNNNNETAGEDTTINFKAEVGASHLQASGNYAANLTITATTL